MKITTERLSVVIKCIHFHTFTHICLGFIEQLRTLRGKGFGKPHSVVNYVFKYEYSKLFYYHTKVMEVMESRLYKPNVLWKIQKYRGKKIGIDNTSFTENYDYTDYIEHNDAYLTECIENLYKKHIYIK